MIFETLINNIDKNIKRSQSPKRYLHILGVRDVACHLAKHFHLDHKKLILAALLHDSAKHLTVKELVQECDTHALVLDQYERLSHSLLHGKVAYIHAQQYYQIHDDDVLLPILYHTTGRAGMSMYEKILFIADYCEPNRKFERSQFLLDKARESLNDVLLEVVKLKLEEIIRKNVYIHPKTLELYHEIVSNEA